MGDDEMRTATIFLASMLLIASSGANSQHRARTKVTRAEVNAVVQAIEDEIYDYEYEVHYFPEGGPVGDLVSRSRTRVPLYVNPWLDGGVGQVVYRLMPHGEVFRLFSMRDDGTVVLGGNPQLGFPASQPDRKTVYFNDSEMERMRHTWAKFSFLVDLDPSPDVVRAAISRQKQRHDGFSEWEFVRSKGDTKR